MPGPPGIKGEPGNISELFPCYFTFVFFCNYSDKDYLERITKSFCGAKAKFLSRRLYVFFYVIFVHGVNNPSAF